MKNSFRLFGLCNVLDDAFGKIRRQPFRRVDLRGFICGCYLFGIATERGWVPVRLAESPGNKGSSCILS